MALPCLFRKPLSEQIGLHLSDSLVLHEQSGLHRAKSPRMSICCDSCSTVKALHEPRPPPPLRTKSRKLACNDAERSPQLGLSQEGLRRSRVPTQLEKRKRSGEMQLVGGPPLAPAPAMTEDLSSSCTGQEASSAIRAGGYSYRPQSRPTQGPQRVESGRTHPVGKADVGPKVLGPDSARVR